jgi:hypothetical protein
MYAPPPPVSRGRIVRIVHVTMSAARSAKIEDTQEREGLHLRSRIPSASAIAAHLAGATLICGQSPPPVNFSRDIKPLFKKRCQVCHGAQQQMRGLRLDNKEDALRGDTPAPSSAGRRRGEQADSACLRDKAGPGHAPCIVGLSEKWSRRGPVPCGCSATCTVGPLCGQVAQGSRASAARRVMGALALPASFTPQCGNRISACRASGGRIARN